jgi:small-conductance mechanosensitive channel
MMCKSSWPIRLKIMLCMLLPMALHAASAPQTSAKDAQVSILTGGQVIQILDDTVEWYRALGTQQQNATQPSDLLILFANRQTADRVVSLAFDMARANAELLSSEASAAAAADSTTASEALTQKQAQLAAEHQSVQQEIATDRQQLASAGKGRQDLEAKMSELQGELAMVDARKNLLDTMTEFVHSSDPKAANANALKGQIDAIAATVPGAGVNGAAATAAPTTPAAAPATAPASAAAPLTAAGGTAPARFGIWDLITEVLRQHNKINTIDAIDARTRALADTFRKISSAPRAQLQAYAAQGDSLAAQADHADGATLKGLRDQFDTLAWLVKQTSEILEPLGKEQVLLERYQHNLASWRTAAKKQYREAWSALAVRLGIVAGILVVVFALGEVWRRAVIRYVHEAHRRYQLLLVRTIVLWTVVVAVIGLSFVTELSTFATFAGLLTAGLAVAMQSVLVSVVGYFFLIGKYGLRVGDRIQVGTVVGEVLDIGLVRLHLMELNQQGPLGSTGRVVAFPNLIVFQTTGGLFKQSSGTEPAWHETTVPLPSVSDYAALKQHLLAALGAIAGEYTPANTAADNAPQVHLRLNNGRMEALIRYPINYRQAADIDERVAQAVLQALAEPPSPAAT